MRGVVFDGAKTAVRDDLELRDVGPGEVKVHVAACGLCTAGHDIPLVVDLYRHGLLKLDELITKRYSLDDWDEAVDDLRSGRTVARGVFVMAS